MNINNLFFHIHYCNYRKPNESRRYSRKINRTLQHHEIIFIKAGKGNIRIGEKRVQFKGGSLLYICPNVPYSIEANIEELECLLTVHFSYVHVNFNDSKWCVVDEVEMLPMNPAQELNDYYHIEDIFKRLAENWNAKLPGYEFITKTLFQQLLIAIDQNLRKQNQNYSTSLKVEKIIQYMHQNINNRITLTKLAEMVQLAPTYLSRTFKETTGYSIIEYFNKIKVDKSKEMLIEGNKKVKEVAQLLGFSDEFYFSRIFKKIEGISPSEYYSKNVHGT